MNRKPEILLTQKKNKCFQTYFLLLNLFHKIKHETYKTYNVNINCVYYLIMHYALLFLKSALFLSYFNYEKNINRESVVLFYVILLLLLFSQQPLSVKAFLYHLWLTAEESRTDCVYQMQGQLPSIRVKSVVHENLQPDQPVYAC